MGRSLGTSSKNQRYYLEHRDAIMKRRQELKEERRKLGIPPPPRRRRASERPERHGRSTRSQTTKQRPKRPSVVAVKAKVVDEPTPEAAKAVDDDELLQQKMQDLEHEVNDLEQKVKEIEEEDKYIGYEARVAILKANEPSLADAIDEMIKRHHGVLWKDQPMFNPWRQALHVDV